MKRKLKFTKSFLIKEYINKRKSIRTIAKENNCGKGTVDYYLIKFDISKRTIAQALIGKKRPLKVREKISKTRKKKGVAKGKKNYFYIHGKSINSKCIDCGKKNDYKYDRCEYCGKKNRKVMWSNQKFKNKMLKKMINGNNFKQNKKEKQLEKILNKLFPKKYKFVGDGKTFIAGFVPDFIDFKNKKIIELFGDYWHNREDSKKRDKRRLKSYAKYGYKTLIVWEHELENIDKLTEKLLK